MLTLSARAPAWRNRSLVLGARRRLSSPPTVPSGPLSDLQGDPRALGTLIEVLEFHLGALFLNVHLFAAELSSYVGAL
jgi:hypothetical protein